MNYSEPLINQVVIFFRSVGAGIILGILYDIFCIIRMAFGERKGVYLFFDTAFFITASFISFFFMVLYNSGQVRFNLMIGELAGALSFHYSIGIYSVRTVGKYIRAGRSLAGALTRPVRRFSEKTVAQIRRRLHSEEKEENKKEKFSLMRKMHLKNKNKSV